MGIDTHVQQNAAPFLHAGDTADLVFLGRARTGSVARAALLRDFCPYQLYKRNCQALA